MGQKESISRYNLLDEIKDSMLYPEAVITFLTAALLVISVASAIAQSLGPKTYLIIQNTP